jgi:hypothetical protein
MGDGGGGLRGEGWYGGGHNGIGVGWDGEWGGGVCGSGWEGAGGGVGVVVREVALCGF